MDVGVIVGRIVGVNVGVNSGLGVGRVGVGKGCESAQPDMYISNSTPITWFMMIFFKTVKILIPKITYDLMDISLLSMGMSS